MGCQQLIPGSIESGISHWRHRGALRGFPDRMLSPLGLMLSEDFSFGMVADDLDVDEAS
jgi:hypothetical protein